MICFKEAELDAMARKKAWMGINKDTFSRTSQTGAYRWHYDVEYVGWKYNGNSIMAAIGLVQLRYLDRDNAYRRQICQWYEAGFEGANNVGILATAKGCESSRHLFQVHISNRDEAMLALNESAIYPGVHYRDNRAYDMFREEVDTCPNATRMSDRIISLPLHLRLAKADVDEVVAAVRRYAR
jgi:dTDP-4-amino-4,6-dideoxygalactose transaminase